jgi:hypothetical protein
LSDSDKPVKTSTIWQKGLGESSKAYGPERLLEFIEDLISDRISGISGSCTAIAFVVEGCSFSRFPRMVGL